MIVATRAAQQPGLLVRKHALLGLSKQHDKKHDIKKRHTVERSQVQYFKKIGMIVKS
jgi:hypothetical protein